MAEAIIFTNLSLSAVNNALLMPLALADARSTFSQVVPRMARSVYAWVQVRTSGLSGFCACSGFRLPCMPAYGIAGCVHQLSHAPRVARSPMAYVWRQGGACMGGAWRQGGACMHAGLV